MSGPVFIAEGRSILVPPGAVVRTGYVPVDRVRLACRDRMAVGDVGMAYERRVQLGDHQAWPCPRGEWEGDRFAIHDGRHEYIAALMLGADHLFVAWIEHAPAEVAVDEPRTPRIAIADRSHYDGFVERRGPSYG